MPVTVSPSSFTAATKGIYYEIVFTASGGTGPYTWALDGASAALPSGLTLKDRYDGTCEISGTPLATGTPAIILNATDSLSVVGVMSATLTVSAKSFNTDAYPIRAELVVLATGAVAYTSGTSLGKVGSKKAVGLHREVENRTRQISGANYVDGRVVGENVTLEVILLERSDVVMGLMHKLTFNTSTKSEGVIQSGWVQGQYVKDAGKTSRLLIRALDDAGAVDTAKPWFFIPYAFVLDVAAKQWADDGGKLFDATALTIVGYWDETNLCNHLDGVYTDWPALA